MASGLAHLRDCLHEHIDAPLLTAFVERWQPDMNDFNMTWGEMTITLHDVWHILRLRIDGDCVQEGEIASKKTPNQQKTELAEFLHANPVALLAEMKRGSIKFQTLQDLGERLEDPEARAGAYLLYLVSSTIFCDKSVDRAKHRFLPLIREARRVDRYAWGAGALAYLYRRLGEATRADCKQLCGSATLLQVTS